MNEEESSNSSENEKKVFARFLETQSKNYKGLKKKISEYILSKKAKDKESSQKFEEDIESIINESAYEGLENTDKNKKIPNEFDSHFDRYEVPKKDDKLEVLKSIPKEEFHFDRYETRGERK